MNKGLKTSPWLVLLLAAILVGLPACGDDTSGDKGGGGIIGGNNRPDASGDVFAPDAQDDTNAPGDDVQDQDTDAGDTNNGPPPTGVFCEATNLGALAGGESKTVLADFSTATSKVQPSCKRGIAKEVVFRFKTTERSSIFASLGDSEIYNDDWVLQINHGSCGNIERLACFEGMPQGFIAEPGLDYYLVLEPLYNDTPADPVELTVRAESIACSPVGKTECSGEDLLYCQSDFTQVARACAYGCSDDACNGDICQNAIPMDSSGTMILEGSLEGFSNKFNFAGKPECFASGVPLTTNAPEVLVALNGLTSGQVVRVDTSEAVGDDNDNAIFIIKGCSSSAPTCVPGVGTDLETLEWTVTEDGDYTLVIDLISAQSPDFAYKIVVE